jgi:hypothetical protein
MTNRYLDQSPLPFELRGPNAFIATQYPSADVVESNSARGPRLHSDVVDESVDHQRQRGDFYNANVNACNIQTDSGDHHISSDQHSQHVVDDVDDFGDFHDNISRQDRIRADRAHILRRDQFDREVSRTRAERTRSERRDSRRADGSARRRRRTVTWPRIVASHDQRTNSTDAELRRSDSPLNLPGSGRREPELPTRHHRDGSGDIGRVAAHPFNVKRLVDGPLHGTALAIYFVLLPFVVITKWSFAARHHDAILVRSLLLLLALLWVAFLFQFVRNVWRLRHGKRPRSGGSAWLAGLVVALLPFLVHSSPASPSPSNSTSLVATVNASQVPLAPIDQRSIGSKGGSLPVPASSIGAVPLALMAKRRSDLLRQHQFVDTDDEVDVDVDATVALLRSLDPDLIAMLRQLVGTNSDGVLHVAPGAVAHTSSSSTDPVVACWLGESPTGSLVAFAREGGRLAIVPSWNNDEIRQAVVSLHEGKVVFADTLPDLMRALATRSLRNTLVVYLGAAAELDDELIACSITVGPYSNDESTSANPAWKNVAPAYSGPARAHEVRVDMLRADPQIVGLYEPLTPTLRRRCVEMLAYLALHRHEPITGDRLRTRVLTHADVDASIRTLANTASAVRRSLGADERGPRLHQVTSSGLYVTHGVTSDVEIFTTLVNRARQLPTADAAPLARQALTLIKGEPLASALRGFEWFLAEGFGARLSRDGEWAALVLHHDALVRDQYELAFWALQQGLLIDPYSDVLREAAVRVPRLREFGSDRTGLSQDEPVSSRRAESMSWSLHGFSHEVTQ